MSTSPPTRTRLPAKRRTEARLLKIGGHTIHVAIGTYSDGRPAEVFLDMHKQGAPLRMFAHALAVTLSIGLQHGIPADAFRRALEGTAGGPDGDVEGDEEIETATSIPDLVVRLLDRIAREAAA